MPSCSSSIVKDLLEEFKDMPHENLHIQTYPPKIDGWKLEEETSFWNIPFSGDMFFFWGDKHSNHRHVESIDCTMLHEQIFAGKGWLYLCPKAFTYQWPFKHSLRSIRNLIYDHFMYVKMSWRFFNATCLSRLSQHPKLPKQSTKE